MSQLVYVIPKAGVRVLDESGAQIPASGAKVVKTAYIHRRMRDGSLTVGKPPVAPKAPAPKTSKE